ncbi:ABC1 kinase family protein [Geomesophilobacter sediminis]|uniref:AarF/ABC1/UbiB kinase family protein n=1 Tax=Geomesophilobacter sediminis TaxID=2798584 RepID=A0A8J7JEW7_9BACT|nr:AarF/ABC1/UbiB kinase family protein [Geomesophilobacter sediminis]MBJ6725886.1 AarF/ABC1/UbiB kinase family protein [Geomesophilobacter sediminis]
MLSLFRFNRNIRSIKRYRQIIAVLASYGLFQLLDYLNLAQFVKRRGIFARGGIADLSTEERVRLALEELGPTFIKLGQLLSTRADIIPPSYIKELSQLQDRVPSIPYEEIHAQIERELGVLVELRFAELNREAIAAASIAQVHRARLHSGEEVVVKVRRPDVEKLVETDIDIMLGMAMLLERHIPRSDIYDPVGVVREFAHTIRRELDLSREGHTIEKIRDNFQGDATLYFPKVYWEATARGVLTIEYVAGIKVNDNAALDAAGLNRREIARRGAHAFLKMVLNHGFFHGDPHPGNVLILPQNVICLLDFGMVGRLTSSLKAYLTDVLGAVINRDVEELVHTILTAGDNTDNVDVNGLKRALADFIDSYYEIPLREIEVGRMLMEFIDIISTYRIKIDPDLTMLVKVLVVIEGMGRQLDPEFDMVEHLRPFLTQAFHEKHSPGRVVREMGGAIDAYLSLAKNLPRDFREILNKINRNKFRIDLEHRGLDRFSRELDRSANRLSLSMIIAALIIGSSIAMHTTRGPAIMGVPAFAFLGYLIAALIGLWWIVAILRSGRL